MLLVAQSVGSSPTGVWQESIKRFLKTKKKRKIFIYRGDSKEPKSAVDAKPGDEEVREVTSGEHSETASGDGRDHKPDPDHLTRVIIMEIRDAVMRPGVSGHVSLRSRAR